MTRQTVDRGERPEDPGTSEPPRHQLESTILGMYHEMPGLSLHLAQAARLFGLASATCQCILDELVGRNHLRRAADGQYIRGAGMPDQAWRTPQM
jgi:hypothetical protein